MNTMSEDITDKSVIRRFKTGDKDAADQLIGKYFDRVRRAAENRLNMRGARASGPDDIAVSVFESLWKKASEKKFAEDELATTDELWRLLSRMIQFKTEDHARRNRAQKRGGGAVYTEGGFSNEQDDDSPGLDGHSDGSFSPAELMELEEGYQALMSKLENEELRSVAVMRMENFKVAEIAKHFGKSERWVKRKLALIRDAWESEVGEGG